MGIQLTPELENYVAERVRAGAYLSPDEAVNAAVEAWRDREAGHQPYVRDTREAGEVDRERPGQGTTADAAAVSEGTHQLSERIAAGMEDVKSGRVRTGEAAMAELQRRGDEFLRARG
jgi:Arc/MetJ-type ribon-helix-helix transcriptional regulator